MIILGIDPGSRKAGYALIECEGRRFKYLESGTLLLEKEGEFLNRLSKAHEESLELVKRFKPDEIALESLIYVKSPTALIKLAQTRGAMLAAFLKSHPDKIFEYAPNLIKAAVSGHGHSDKEGMQKALQMMFGKNTTFKTHDESDALAIAVCHGLQRTSKIKVARMIGHIQGVVLFSDGTETILETSSGIGYQIYYNRILPEGATAALFISHIVKENSEELYGFHSLRAKKLFEMLLTVKNIGPKSAFALMRALAVKDICDAILLDNKKLLTSAPGVGPKAAAQMILDLQGKIQKVKMFSDKPALMNGTVALASTPELEYVPEELPESASEAGLLNEALMACKELGFKEDKIKPLAMKILSENQISKPEQLVHLVLKGL